LQLIRDVILIGASVTSSKEKSCRAAATSLYFQCVKKA
jgi:hypothetical protein